MNWQETIDSLCSEPDLFVNRAMTLDLLQRLREPTDIKLEQDFPDSRPYLTIRWGEGNLHEEDGAVMVIVSADGWGIFHAGKCTHVDRENVDEVVLVLGSKIH